MKILTQKRGFTLVELMVVIVIIGGLMAVLYAFLGRKSEIWDKADKIKIQVARGKLDSALFDFRSKYSRFPTNEEGLTVLTQKSNSSEEPGGELLKEDILDPWLHPYQYSVEGNKYKIVTLGADGRPGGDGINADVDIATLK